ncbi:MAG: hypothetical protein ACLQPD_17750 [Desulfomonilaceae bacterium]
MSTVLLTLWSLLPSCSGRQDQGSFSKTETDNIKNLTIPNGSYPTDDPDKPIGLYGVTAAWEFDTAMNSEAYVRWVSSRLEHAFTPHTNAQSGLYFSRYLDGDEETIQIDTTSRSEKLHVLVTLEMYPD